MFDKITNLKIVSITFIHDYFQILFEDETGLNIYNKYKIKNLTDYRKLIYKMVTLTKKTKDTFIIYLTNGVVIEVGLKADDYNGPEAMELVLPNGQSIIERGDE